jgi:hypothetical protein
LAALFFCAGAAACVNQNGTCEERATCQDCTDPAWASAHPFECSAMSDGGSPDAPTVQPRDGAPDVSETFDGSISEAGDASVAMDATPTDANGEQASPDADSGAPGSDARPDAIPDGPVCDPTSSPSVSTCVIDERYGVFVTPTGDDAAAGTRAAPLRTMAAALDRAHTSGLRVYACAGTTGFAETMTVAGTWTGVAAFGGFACPGLRWTYSTARTATVSPPSGAALVIQRGASGVLFEDFDLESTDAVGNGASSIGVIVDNASGVFRRVRFAAGQGADGAVGADGVGGADGDVAGAEQDGQGANCTAAAPAALLGGVWPGASACGSFGGTGGSSSQSLGQSGAAGTPMDNVTPAGVDNGGLSDSPGVDGDPGSPGDPGAAGTAITDRGSFSVAGYTPAAAAHNGTIGHPGQGGGGGGASTAVGAACVGASGGAGGMGGCGGQPGRGGTGGGASVALLSIASDISLESCDLISSAGGGGGLGGAGGGGGAGAAGGNGGAGAANTRHAGAGGVGGDGGAGGPGAGGNGGPSYALVFTGSPPARTATTTFTQGTGGARGMGGLTNAGQGVMIQAPNGNAGQAAPEFAAGP